MSKEKLPEHKLQALWRALDHGNVGSISCQEWLPFVKRGAAALQAADRAREQALKEEKRRLLRNEEVEQFKAASRKAEAATRASLILLWLLAYFTFFNFLLKLAFNTNDF